MLLGKSIWEHGIIGTKQNNLRIISYHTIRDR
jgi:hypothetical protein